MPLHEYPDHTCMCRHCHPEAFPSGERTGEGHVALRFDEPRVMDISVYLDGERLRDCDEAIPGATHGEAGTVVRFRHPAHQCCPPVHGEPNSGACSYVQRGYVRVVRPIAEG